ncbi:Ni,Fe-hydrogenase I cytochrome b subunit [Mucilaginibacter sp. PPCGB 2223]|uniref:cytochrome b/b6 domain-containing protein n=1 Tax=Mucilaginibacter sp. PPCGB 2223 TaxID=1886027 RepID=UPI000826EE8B|nr:cytochrome b/b6 domain-containing protein [Mucilaginibacter sp. PPCGB 2223]OCX53128.1 Ni,Fe-hydrogenase I cytochrome b subunit [Mucilaginibacter sp. PPCGB 2223]
MSTIEPLKTEPVHPAPVKNYSAAIRLWHWLNAIVISGSLITVLINSTILNTRGSAPTVLSAMQRDSANVTLKQARTAVHALNDKVWDVHIWFGYFLAALLLLRLIAELTQTADQKFIRRFRDLWKQFFYIKNQREPVRHALVVKSIYVAFYITLVVIVCTGLSLAFDDVLPFMKNIGHDVKEIHGFCMYLVLAFITVHIVGVFLAERKDSKGIVSDMINGG